MGTKTKEEHGKPFVWYETSRMCRPFELKEMKRDPTSQKVHRTTEEKTLNPERGKEVSN